MNQTEFYQAKLTYEIDPSDLKAELDAGGTLVVLDARKVENFLAEHIPGAMSFPHRSMDAESLNTLDPSFTYVTYCDGIGCNASTKAALKLSAHGLKVRELIGGIEWWKKDGYETEGVTMACCGGSKEGGSCGCH